MSLGRRLFAVFCKKTISQWPQLGNYIILLELFENLMIVCKIENDVVAQANVGACKFTRLQFLNLRVLDK